MTLLKRKAFERFTFWKEHKTKQALLVAGARQVGKTFLVRHFMQQSYRSYAEFNLVERPDIQASFKAAKGAEDLMLRISLASEQPLVPHETVIFFDEVQECPEILTQIKFLVDKGEYDFILSGSLLGIELESIRSLPVGYVTQVEMFPLDFEEFCWANSLSEQAFPILRNALSTRTPVPDYLHTKMLDLFHRYLLIGGMPDAVSAFLATGTIDQVRIAQNDIRKLYKLDISKYAPKDRRLVIQNIYELIPSELAGKNRRFKLSSIENIKRFSQVNEEFLWLTSAGVALCVHNVTAPTRPLLLSKGHSLFKLFFSDVGLLTSTFLKQTTLDLLDGKSGINLGSTYENAVAQELKAHGFESYYYTSSKIGELDFVVEQSNGDIFAFEIKSGSNYKTHAALDNALAVKDFDIKHAYVLAEANIEQEGAILYLPIYCIALFDQNG